MTEDSYMIPVIFHNLKGYDLHLILQYVTREYSIDVIPTTSEKVSKSAIFASSKVYNFLPPPSTRWSKVWLRMAEINLAIPRGITRNYPYEYMVGRDKFSWTELPPIDAFYSSLSEEISLRKSTSEIRKCGENSKLKTCNNITIFI